MTDLAAALLRDVRLFVPEHDGLNDPDEIQGTLHGWCRMQDVRAALTAALDGVTERAVEVVEAALIADGLAALDWSNTPIGHKVLLRGAVAALRCVPALLAQNAALRAERDRYLRHLTAGAESLNAYKARAEAAEAEVEKLRGALMVARSHVANNAEGWSVSRGAARDDLTIVDAALTTEKPHE